MAFINLYSGSRLIQVNLDRVTHMESRGGSGTTLYFGKDDMVLVTATPLELEAYLGHMPTIGFAAAPKASNAAPEGMGDFGPEGPPDYIPKEERR